MARSPQQAGDNRTVCQQRRFMSAPYRYVPLSAFVHQPYWAHEVSIDRPFKDGVSGWLDVKITAAAPLLIGGERIKKGTQDHIYFFKTPDDNYAIPGSSWRGMLRAILEICSFGRGVFMDDVREGLRDLSRTTASDVYRQRLAKVEAGWLLPRDEQTGEVCIQPCSWAKFRLSEVFPPGTSVGASQWNEKLSVRERYAALGTESRERTLYVVEKAHWQDSLHGAGEAFSRPGPGRTKREGTLVFTAKPVPGKVDEYKKKNREFFFYRTPGEGPPKLLLGAAWAEFLRLNTWDVERKNVGGDHRRPGWSYWSERYEKGEKVPVFFIRDGDEIDALGTCSMFRIPHKLSKSEMAANTSPSHNDGSLRDIPSLIFGPAGDDAAAGADDPADERAASFGGRTLWKGRVSFETAVGVPNVKEHRPEIGPVVLATPHGGFYPATVRQPTAQGRLLGDRYAMFTPSSERRELAVPELAGRRRYPSRSDLALHNDGSEEMRAILHAVAEGSEFQGRIRFHNLKPEELGALVWSIRLWADSWGDEPKSRLHHKLGMAKSMGLGEVILDIMDARIEYNCLKDGKRQIVHGVEKAKSYADKFAKHMTDAYKEYRHERSSATWESSEQIETLLAFADPKFSRATDLKMMSLGEYTKSKREGLVLPPNRRRSAGTDGRDPGSEVDQDVFPRQHSGDGKQKPDWTAPSANAGRGKERRPAERHAGSGHAGSVQRYRTGQGDIVEDIGPGNTRDERSVRFDDGEVEPWPVSDLTPI